METERIHNVVNLDGAILNTLLSLLSRRIGTSVFKTGQLPTLSPRISGTHSLTDIDGTKGNHGAIDFVDDTINLLHVVTVGHELIAGNDILKRAQISVEWALKGILIEDLHNACDKSRWGKLGITECADLVNYHFGCNSRRKT